MSTLKTSINLSSTTLFPTPVNFTKAVTENISGGNNGFSSVEISAASSQMLFSTDSNANGSVLYFYAETPTTNPAAIDLSISYDQTTLYFARLNPGDVIYMPLWADVSGGIEVTADNGIGGTSIIQYFIGTRS